jgi:serine/threonine protein phosphatase PrpC
MGDRRITANICYLSHTGKVRGNNEDSLLVNEILISEGCMEGPECQRWEGERLMCLVADGLGGHRKGEVASRTVLDVFRSRYEEADSKEQVARIVPLAREGLNRIVEADRGSFGLGTTISGIVIVKGKGTVFNCGDSRVYCQRGNSLERITKDHSLVQELADAGMITEEEMRTHPQKNIITSSLMGDLGHHPPVFSVRDVEIRSGDRFFLCTDGVWESMSHAEMERCLQADGKAVVRCIFHKIFSAGARDNLTMIVVDIIERD